MTLQRFSPDTCGCIIHQEVINDVITFYAMENACPAHVSIALNEGKRLSANLVGSKRSQAVDKLEQVLKSNRDKNVGVILKKMQNGTTRKIALKDESGRVVGEYEEEIPPIEVEDTKRQMEFLDRHEEEVRQNYGIVFKKPFAWSENTYNTVIEENQRKNVALQVVVDNGPPALYDMVDGVRKLKSNIIIGLSWNQTAPNRVLTISFSNITLTNQQKNTIRNALNNRLGTGKVLIT